MAKSSTRKPLTLATLDSLPPVNLTAPEDQDVLRGQQLTEQFHRATTAIREVIVFGAMILQLQEVILSARGQVRTGGAKSKGTGLEAWLQKYAPEVSRPTAYRFRDLAEGVREEFKLGKKVDLQQLLTASALELASDALRKKQSTILEFIAGRSQRQLLLAFEKGQHGAGGGKHRKRKQGPELTPEEQQAEFEAACREDVIKASKAIDLLGDKWKAVSVTDAERDQMAELFAQVAADIRKWNKVPVHKRTRVDAAELLDPRRAGGVEEEEAAA